MLVVFLSLSPNPSTEKLGRKKNSKYSMGNFVFIFFFSRKKSHTQIKTRWSPGAPPADLREQREGREDAWSCAKHSALGLQHCDVALEALGAWSQRYKCNKNSYENEPLNSVWSWSVMASGNPPGQTGPFYPLHCSDSKRNLTQLPRPETEHTYCLQHGALEFPYFQVVIPLLFVVSSQIESSAASPWHVLSHRALCCPSSVVTPSADGHWPRATGWSWDFHSFYIWPFKVLRTTFNSITTGNACFQAQDHLQANACVLITTKSKST